MAVDNEKIRAHLERLVASPEFARADRHARFLRFVVDKTLQGDLEALRERQIGIEVYERPHDWDPKLDNIVRGEARRLRAKLDAHKSVGNPGDAVRITMPKGGYAVCFEELRSESGSSADSAHTLPRESSAPPVPEVPAVNQPAPRGGNRAFAVGIVLLLLCIAWFIGSHRKASDTHSDDFQIVPFSSEAGKQFSPSISPDGKQIAFVWDGGSDGQSSIYIKSVGAGTSTRFTNAAAFDTHPSWSPDGSQIAFVRFNPNETLIILKSVLDGGERILRRMPYNLSTWSSANPFSECQTLSWFPAGDRIALTASLGDPKGYGLLTISTRTGEEQILTTPVGEDHDCYSHVSPDGRMIAFMRFISHAVGNLYTVRADGKDIKQLTFDKHDLRGLDWTPDSKKIVFASKQRGAYELRAIGRDGGESVPLPSDAGSVSDPAVAREGNYVAFVESEANYNLWRAPIVGGRIGKAERFIASSGLNHSPSYSPDGQTIGFVSDRSGNPEIWFSDADGDHLRQATHFGGPWLGTIRWSPDSRQIVFDARPNGHSAIFTMTVAGGNPRELESEAFEDRRPSWSRDGNAIYYDSTRSGRPEIWKRNLRTGQSQVVAPPPSIAPLESLDGSRLFFSDGDTHVLWTSKGDGTDAKKLLQIRPNPDLDWAFGERDLFFTETTKSGAEFFAYDLAGGSVRSLGQISGTLSIGTPSLTVSPDGRWLVFGMVDHEHSDIKLREGVVR